MNTRTSHAGAIASLSHSFAPLSLAVALGACGGAADAGSPAEGEAVEAASEALATDGQVCITVQRGAADAVGAVADATIWQQAPTWNTGAATGLSTGASLNAGPRRSLLRFDLPAIPAGARVVSATVSLQQLYRNGGGTTVEAFRVTAPWDEGTATWGTLASAFDPAPVATFTTVAGAPAVQTLDVRDLAQAWVDDGDTNHGIVLAESDTLPPSFTDYRSSESPYQAQRPRLDLCYETCAEPPCAIWSKGFDPMYVEVQAAPGNDLVLAGTFEGTINLGGGPLTCVDPPDNEPPIVYPQDIVVARLDAAGNHLWSKRIGGLGPSSVNSAVDAAGNIFLAGAFGGTLDFGGGVSITSVGPRDFYLARLDPAGTPVWVQRVDGPESSYVNDLAVDPAGNLILTGVAGSRFPSTDTTAGFGVGDLLSEAVAFVVKLDPAGNLLWIRSAYTYGEVPVNFGQIAVDAADLFIAGYAEYGIGFREGAENLDGAGGMVLRLDASNGALGWGAFLGAATPGSIAVDGAGGVAVGGLFMTSADLGSGPVVVHGVARGFAAKLDAASGALQWGKALPDTMLSQVSQVAFVGGGDVIAAGRVELPLVSDGSGGWVFDESAAPLTSYLARWTSNGDPVWIREYGSTTASSGAYALTVDGAGNAVVFGDFGGPMDFGAGPLSPAYGTYLLKLAP